MAKKIYLINYHSMIDPEFDEKFLTTNIEIDYREGDYECKVYRKTHSYCVKAYKGYIKPDNEYYLYECEWSEFEYNESWII